MDSSLWRRTFTRGTQPNGTPIPDVDSVADKAFINANFKDKFGIWLTQGNNKLIGSLDGLLSTFYKDSAHFQLQTYLVGDGTYIPKEDQRLWYNAHVRLLSVVTPPTGSPVSSFTGLPWLFFIVGSNDLASQTRFLQVASWDKTTFRFYQRDAIQNHSTSGWIFQGESMDAFGDPDQYLGPFNGHVNGACIMKEIHQPWIHWLSPTDDLTNCFSQADLTALKNAPYLTKPGESRPLAGATVLTADNLEPLILSGLQAWFTQRRINDFSDSQGQLATQPKNIQRWVSHLLLTTTVNIAGPNGQDFTIPPDHFFDNELLVLQPGFTLTDDVEVPIFAFDGDMYQKAVTDIGLCLLQEIPVTGPVPPEAITLPMQTLGGGKQTDESNLVHFVVATEGEGIVPFTILQSSIEDSYGAAIIQKLKAGNPAVQLFSESTVNAIFMVDFWNPIYSWRRGRLMQYVPTSTTLHGTTYDLESTFLKKVKASSHFKDPSSPEYAFTQLLGASVTTHQGRIEAYFTKVCNRLKTYNGLLDYMKLAESRRRIYRPLPLDEFGATLPYARKLGQDLPMYEMTEAGTIQSMPAEGTDFLHRWIGNLAGYDPHLLLNENSADQGVVHPSLLPRPANLPLLCQNLRSADARASVQSCPFMRRRDTAGAKSVPSIATLPQLDSK